jgi:hypothetical protein
MAATASPPGPAPITIASRRCTAWTITPDLPILRVSLQGAG